MGDHDALTPRTWSSIAWLLLVGGMAVALWGVSMGLNRYGSASGPWEHNRNVEAIVRVVLGVLMIVSALVMATVVAHRLPRFERAGWKVGVWMSVFLGATVPVGILAEATAGHPGGDPSAALGFAFEVLVKTVIGAGLVALVGAMIWAKFIRSGERSMSPPHP